MVKAMSQSGAYDYAPSSSASSTCPGIVARTHDKRDVAALSARVQKMERALDLTKYIAQVEKLLAQPIKIPGSTLVHHQGRGPNNRRPSIFSAKGIYPTEEIRKHKLSKLFNFQNVKEREWLQEILLEESDSDDDGEMLFTVRDIRAAVKVHQMRRKLQKRYHSDRSNSQFTYYSAGLLSNDDPFPDHQSMILRNLTQNRTE